MTEITEQIFEELRPDMVQELEQDYQCEVRMIRLEQYDTRTAIGALLLIRTDVVEYKHPFAEINVIDFHDRYLLGRLDLAKLKSTVGFTLTRITDATQTNPGT